LRYCRSRFFTFVFFMQKLTGTSSGQNNKSCRIIHLEPNKIGFTFFCFFCDFLRNLQESANSLYYFSCAFAGRPSKRKASLQCRPWERWPARAGQIPAMRRRIPAGEGKGGALGAWFGALDRAVAAPASGSPAASECGRRGLCCGAAEPHRGWSGMLQGQGKGGAHA
jgi:hypothetical protein